MSKTVIMVWIKTDSGTQHDGSIKSYGLGDLLRGTIFLHQMSVRYGFKLIVDLSMNPISKHLIVHKHDHAEYVNANMNKTCMVHYNEHDKFDVIYKASLINPEPLLICTNLFCNEHLSVECKQFMKTLLTPNEQFSTYINEQNALYNLSAPYSIIHIRLGDDEFFNTKSANNSNMTDAIKIMKQHTMPGNILMSNSQRFKNLVKSLHGHGHGGIAMFNTHPLHLGELSTIFHDVAESFRETLYEFFVLGNSSSIKTYSTYSWVSGFVKFAGLIHDVPVIDIKQPPSSTHREIRDHKVVIPASNKLWNSMRFKPTISVNRSHATLNHHRLQPKQNFTFGIKH